LTTAHQPPASPPPGEPPLTRGQRARQFARDVLVDRVCGWVGLRSVRLPWLGRHGLVVVFAETVDCLVDAVVRPDGVRAGDARRVTVVVAWWTAPWRGWTGRPGPLRGVVRQRVRFPARGRGPVTMDLVLAEPAPVRETLAAALFALRPNTRISDARTSPGPVQLAERRPAAILVDDRRINPRGRRPESYRSDAPRFALEFDSPGEQAVPAVQSTMHTPAGVADSGRNAPPWEWPGASRWRHGADAELAWPTVTALRSVGIVECGYLPGRDPVAEASLLAQLAMTGVVLHAPEVSDAVADLLAPQLRGILAEPLPAQDTGPLALEIRSVRQRRAALRAHSVQFGQLGAPTVSAILATKRSEHLPAILRAIAHQTYPELEIVLCLHGIELPDPCREFLDHCGRPVEIVPVSGEVSFGVALGLATARASGSLVTKFDDDDTYGPQHVWDLVLARGFSGATLVGKGIEFVHLEDADVTIRRRSGQPEAETDVVAGGTMLIARGELEELGGWRPVPRSVDRGLLDRVNRSGASIYRTHPLGYLYHRRSQGHTWDATDEFFLRNARQRWEGLPRLAEFGTAVPDETGAPTPSRRR
jgi:hypothetical protein